MLTFLSIIAGIAAVVVVVWFTTTTGPKTLAGFWEWFSSKGVAVDENKDDQGS